MNAFMRRPNTSTHHYGSAPRDSHSPRRWRKKPKIGKGAHHFHGAAALITSKFAAKLGN